MSDFEMLRLAGVILLALAGLFALAAIRYGITRHVLEVYNDVSGRRRRSELAEQGPHRRPERQVPLDDVAARMEALTLVASAQSQDEIATRIASEDEEGEYVC